MIQIPESFAGASREISFAGKVMPGDIAGSYTQHGYVLIGVLKKRFFAHRLAWFFTHGIWPAAQLDHINGDRRDNRITNLREATNAQNQCNRKPTARTGVKGVYKHSQSPGWTAEIKVGGKKHHIGLYPSILAAEVARGQAAAIFHGKFARF